MTRVRERCDALVHINPFSKYSGLWMDIAERCALESTAVRNKVGCVIVTLSGGIYTGYNGTVPGTDNTCEINPELSSPFVIHAEENALDKMLKDGVSAKDSVVFQTLTPCIPCSKRLLGAGVAAVFYRDVYRCREGIDFLISNGVVCKTWDSIS